MDGTLYDEFEFISQAYTSVAPVISKEIKCSFSLVYYTLCEKWLEYGSSGNIFQITSEELVQTNLSSDIIKKCVDAFRRADFCLTLPKRAEFILENICSQEKRMFLITDGNSSLQRRKIEKLKLERWFPQNSIIISGDYGGGCQKPSPFMFDKIKNMYEQDSRIIYIGDRIIDKNFSENIGVSFMCVKVMQPVKYL